MMTLQLCSVKFQHITDFCDKMSVMQCRINHCAGCTMGGRHRRGGRTTANFLPRCFDIWTLRKRSQKLQVSCKPTFVLLSPAEQAMGRWVMGQWVKWVIFLNGSHGSWVIVRWPMTHVRPVPIWGLINFINNFDYYSQKNQQNCSFPQW